MTDVNLNWSVAGEPATYSIYRSLTNIDPSALPAPIAEGVIEKSYTDTTAEENNVYYYRVSAVKGSQSKISDQITVFTSQLWWDSVRVLEQSKTASELFHDILPTANRSTIGDLLPSTTLKYYGGVLAQDGKIYCIPNTAQDVHVIDPATNTSVRTNFGYALPSGYKFSGGVLAQDGKIYAVPSSTELGVLVIDPIAQSMNILAMGGQYSGAFKWNGCVLAPNGKIYGVPYNSTDILVIDVNNQTVNRTAMGADLSGSSKWQGGVLAPNGKIYCAPYNSMDILIIDPELDTAYTIPSGLAGSGMCAGAVLGADGKIYCVPYNVQGIIVINPINDTTEFLGYGNITTPSGSYPHFSGGCLGYDGKIYFMPQSATVAACFDPLATPYPLLTEILANGSNIAGQNKFSGGVMCEDGSIYSVAASSRDTLKITLGSGVDAPDGKLCRSPHYNKF